LLFLQEKKVMKKDYKSTEIRLANYFEDSRDKWKERSLKYQKEKRQYLKTIKKLQKTIDEFKLQLKSSADVTSSELENIVETKKKVN
jgi:hypothetical protein